MPTLKNLVPCYGSSMKFVYNYIPKVSSSFILDVLYNFLSICQIFYDSDKDKFLTVTDGYGSFIGDNTISFIGHSSGNLNLDFSVSPLRCDENRDHNIKFKNLVFANGHSILFTYMHSFQIFNRLFLCLKEETVYDIRTYHDFTPFDKVYNYGSNWIRYPSKEECFGNDYWELTIPEFLNSYEDYANRPKIQHRYSGSLYYYTGGIYEPRNGAQKIYWIGCPTLECPSDGVSIVSPYNNIFFYVKDRNSEYNEYPVYSIEGGYSDVVNVLWRGIDGFWYGSRAVGELDSNFGYFKSETNDLEHLNQSSYTRLNKVYTGETPRVPPISDYIEMKNFPVWFQLPPKKQLYIINGVFI